VVVLRKWGVFSDVELNKQMPFRERTARTALPMKKKQFLRHKEQLIPRGISFLLPSMLQAKW
jgi:hypothetical protein